MFAYCDLVVYWRGRCLLAYEKNYGPYDQADHARAHKFARRISLRYPETEVFVLAQSPNEDSEACYRRALYLNGKEQS